MKYTMNRLIIIFLALYCISFFSINNAFSKSRYIITNILIKIDSANTADIRNKAITKAQHEAFEKMIEPIVHPEEIYKLFPIDNNILNKLVSGVELKEELILDTGYKANFTINFNPKRVREFFEKNKIIYSETESRLVNLVPILSSNFNQIEFEDIWNNTWKESNKNDGLFNLKITERLNLNNPSLSLDEFLSLNISEEMFLNGQSNNILLWANYIQNKNNDEINVIIKCIFKERTFTLTKKYIIQEDEVSVDLIKNSVVKLSKELFNLWIESTSTFDITTPYKIRVIDTDLKTWSAIEKKMSNIKTIKKVDIEYYEINNLMGTIYFDGNLSKLKLILSENNISLTFLGKYSDIKLISE